MNRKLNILKDCSRKTLWILFTLFVGLSFSAGGVLANSCQGGPDCLVCAAAVHPHIPGMDAEMANQGCRSAEQNSSCGFETGRSADEFDRTAAVVNSGTHPYSGIFSAASDESDQAHLYREFITQFQNPDRSELTPIYLLNLSLLC
ncbi:hypothetical protein ACFL2S_03370 [Thermodesulfobacteriota bacterium]